MTASPPRVCLIGTYPPRQCGIATFTQDLFTALIGAGVQTGIVAITNGAARYDYPDEVVFEVHDNQLSDYRLAAEYLNASEFDILCLQHEFGIMGGAHGRYITELLDHLRLPVVTTLHTVQAEFEEGYRSSLQRVLDASDNVVVLNSQAMPMLTALYGVDPERVEVVPHGVPDVPFVDPDFYKDVLGAEGRTLLLTFGHLSRNKGIEVVLDALSPVVAAHPDVLYVVLGATHPEVRARQGEEYREHLQQRVVELGLEANVEFRDHYVALDELVQYLGGSDIYITPYQSREQISSGTLAYAVGAGSAVVSTPYRHAQELLADGRGVLFDFGDVDALSAALLELVEDVALRNRYRKRAYAYGRSMTWPVVGARHRELFDRVASTYVAMRRPPTGPGGTFPVARPSLAHLSRLTDDTGLAQHASSGVVDRSLGYTTDDVGRGLVVAVEQWSRTGDAEAGRLASCYLGFLRHAQRPEGSFENVLTFDRRWLPASDTQDTLGQAVWGLGAALAVGPETIRPLVTAMLDRALPAVCRLDDLRGQAYAICGLYGYLSRYPGALTVRRTLEQLADRMVARRASEVDPAWRWFEDRLTYANAKLPHALLLASRACDRPEWEEVGLEALDFLLGETWTGNHFDFVGNEHWHVRGADRSPFGQQPIEAGYTAEACMVAYELAGQPEHLERARAAVEWLVGRNRLGAILWDDATGACADGLDRAGASVNAGAESVVCALIGLLAVPPAGATVQGATLVLRDDESQPSRD